MEKITHIVDMLPGVSVYHRLKTHPLIHNIYELCLALTSTEPQYTHLVECYSGICKTLFDSPFRASLPDYLFDLVLSDENIYTKMCAKNEYIRVPLAVKKAVEYDLNILYMIASVTSDEIKALICDLFKDKTEACNLLPDFVSDHKQFQVKRAWGSDLISIGDFHRRNGVGIFTKYYAYYLDSTYQVTPIVNFAPLTLDSLKKYEAQKKMIVGNTMSFLNRKPANNVLLYGDRGTGKSTTVKAILQEFHPRGLRMLQLSKDEIVALPKVLEEIANIPLRFIVFIDDLTFSEDEAGFNKLKAMLEGSLFELPENVLIYATSNRIHLMKETFTSRAGDDLHAGDTRDEAASLADRFGLTVTFFQPNLEDFMEIVLGIAQDRNLKVPTDELRRGATAFAMRKGSRSGRVAKQYIDDVEGRLTTVNS